MEAIAEKVIGLLASSASKELELICNFQDDLESMKSMVTAIKAVLLDAETKSTKSHLINDWLEKLKDVLLDAEDLLDACSADELARQVMTKGKKANEVRIFFSRSNRIVCAAKMGREIKAIKKKLDGIFNDMNKLNLIQSSSSNASVESYDVRETYSSVWEEDVVGRDNERMHLVDILLSPPNVKNNVSVVAIVGIGGLGKTTLAQQVFHDEAVKNYFELRRWVCVSDEFNIKRIAQNIIEKECGTMEDVAQRLNKTIEEKRFLLVLDDVWNEDGEEWHKLEKLLSGGEKGSMIIVTTRSDRVAQIMGTLEPLKLDDLDFKNSWKLFCRVAFRDGKGPDNQELVRVGKDIVRKCSGLPLAIRTIGSLLFTKKLGVTEWSYFRDTELANIDSDEGGNKIFSILKLSYDHLPSHLKNCFKFCSLFPKDYEIERKTLIQMWIAEGFIRPLHNRRLEDVGDQCFQQLLSRCLFQDVRLDDFGDIEWCKMHDLMHDLAHSITRNECYFVTSEWIEEEKFGDGIRHVSSHLDSAWKFPSGSVKTKKVRTILSLKGRCEFISSQASSRFFCPICRSKTSLPKYLRVLDLSNQDLEIPESIGDLKHLRYLDLSGNKKLEKLPRGITKLYNLLTLRLNDCSGLKEFPRDMKRLVKLRHLELDDCDGLTCTPCGLGFLTDIQTLTTFVVDKSSGGGGARITELCDIKLSMGRLEIRGLGRQRSNMKEVESSKLLLHMPCLQTLVLKWSTFGDEDIWEGDEVKVEDEDEIILEALEPPPTIKGLYIQGFCGKGLSEWIGRLTTLQFLFIVNCIALASLLESLGSLTSLQELYITDCGALASLPKSLGSLTSLQKLDLSECRALAALPESFGSLTSLQELSIMNCEALASLPESLESLTSLQKLSIVDCEALASLPESLGSLTSLQELSIWHCKALASLPESLGTLTSLQELSIMDCEALASLPESLGSLTSLQELSIMDCEALASLPESLKNLTSLQKLELLNCRALASLPSSVESLTSLKYFIVRGCSALTERYGPNFEGVDWPGLAHIPCVRIS